MKKILVFATVPFMAFGCATSKKVTDISLGTWDYTIKETPMGDLSGHFIITKDGDVYSGFMNSERGNFLLNTISIEDDEINCAISYEVWRSN